MLKKFKLKNIIATTLSISFIILFILTQVADVSAPPSVTEPSFAVFGKTYSTATCVELPKVTYTYYDLSKEPFEKNNKFGLYVYAENKDFIRLADNLVNSNGGEWGYVLIPYNVRDKDYAKWSGVFSTLSEKKLIPIVQLHDIETDRYEEQTERAAEFLNSFMWPIKQRYISVYNEPNDAKFWYNRLDPAEYARILDFTIYAFKRENSDFFMMNGAFNVSAPTDAVHMDSFQYMRRMESEVPGIFKKLDGWASHAYPQPNFSGNPRDKGRWSIKAYEEELNFLKSAFGVEKELPVFITETGWAHAEGEIYNGSFPNIDRVSENFKYAYEEVWLPDDRVVAVTPFTVRYDPPFDHFSWVNKDNVPYKHYEVVKSLPKVKGEPQMLIKQEIEGDCNDSVTNS